MRLEATRTRTGTRRRHSKHSAIVQYTATHLICEQTSGQEVQPQPGCVLAQDALALPLDRLAQQPLSFPARVDVCSLSRLGCSALLASVHDQVLHRLLVRLHAHAPLRLRHLLRLFVVREFL